MKMWVLGSGSRGNAVLLESAGSRVLIDAGFPVRVIADRLTAIGVAGESIEAVVLTHEHSDHVRGAGAGARRWGWSIYATPGTVAAYPSLRADGAHVFEAGATLELGELTLHSVCTPHDAADPVAFVVTARSTGARAGVAYDLGHATPAIRTALADLDLLVLETNHDEGMLRAGPYPPCVRNRIAGSHGHLSNRAAAALARSCANRGLAHVVLAHLSDCCNTPALATDIVRSALASTCFRGSVLPAPQDGSIGPFSAGSWRRSKTEQLVLAL